MYNADLKLNPLTSEFVYMYFVYILCFIQYFVICLANHLEVFVFIAANDILGGSIYYIFYLKMLIIHIYVVVCRYKCYGILPTL